MRASSVSLGKAVYISSMSEPSELNPFGIYLGRTEIYKLPFYLDRSSLVNPHLTIIGMSGSGKSYLLKSILVRSAVSLGSRVLVIDWNNEYNSLTLFLSGKVLNLDRDFKINILELYLNNATGINEMVNVIDTIVQLNESQKPILHSTIRLILDSDSEKHISIKLLIERLEKNPKDVELSTKLRQLQDNPLFANRTEFDIFKILNGIYSINLSSLRDNTQKVALMQFIIKMVISQMHRLEIGESLQRIIVLDEAWRLIKNAEEIGILFREGRKYGVSIIAATQLVSDVNNELMANSGCIIIFRLQNENDYRILSDAGITNQNINSKIGSLKRGSCMVCLSSNSGAVAPNKFFIDKISGVELESLCFSSDNMRIEISHRKFIEATSDCIESIQKEKILSFISENGRNIEASKFVRFLTGLGLSRAEIVSYFKELGVEDYEIIRAYENAW